MDVESEGEDTMFEESGSSSNRSEESVQDRFQKKGITDIRMLLLSLTMFSIKLCD